MDSKYDSEVTIPGNPEQQLIEQLDALQPSKQQQKAVLFQKLYPAIERALAREVPQKTIVAQLKQMELQLSMGGFRSMLEAERKLHAEKGECLYCAHCGSPIPTSKEQATQQVSAIDDRIEE